MVEEEKAELEELYENSEWWHNRFNAVQRDYEELKKRNKELEDGFKSATDELCEYATKIDKAIEFIKEYGRDKQLEEDYLMSRYNLAIYNTTLLEILGDKENE